ncbi:phage major tail protein 2, partial [uncultured Mediterranean phage MEDS3 group]
MSVYLGTHGEIELQRQFDGSSKLSSTIVPGDVNATAKRFSFDFDHGQLITGDQIEIKGNTTLGFISGYTKDAITRFIHVDELDGIRLYESFAHAVNGGTANAVALAAINTVIDITVEVQNAVPRLLAQVTSFELNTERETVDTTSLSDEFRTRINTLMSGSGRISGLWEYTGSTANELPHYLLELALRTKVGSQFKGRFYLKVPGYNPGPDAARNDDEVYYECTGVLTSCALQFSPDSVVRITADFITTSTIQIRMQIDPGGKIEQETSDDIL